MNNKYPDTQSFFTVEEFEPNKISYFLSSIVYISKLQNVDDILFKIAGVVRNILECDRMSIFVWDKKNEKLWTKVAHGLSGRIEVDKEAGIVGWTFKNQKSVIINDPYSDPRFNPEIDRKTGYKTKNILATPLKTYSGDVIGVIEAINKLDGDFSEKDAKLAEVVSIYISSFLENSLLYEEIKKTQEEIVYRLSIAAEFRDSTTYKHLIRMSLYSYLVAKEMGFDESWCEKIRLAAPMHDIGKIGIKDSILLKPAKLTEKEFEEMKNHTIYGYEILKESDIEVLQVASNIAACHHEKYDGTGYPRGLKGGEIPIEARIVSVADVFDALTSKRPYKEPFPPEKAVEYIRKESGKSFDPKVVSAFLKALPKILEVMDKNKDENI